MKMNLGPYLIFDGNCAEAMQTYADILDGKVAFMLAYGDSEHGAGMSPDAPEKIMHARVDLGDFAISGADDTEGEYLRPQGFHTMLNFDDIDTARSAFDALAEGGEIRMPLEATFWTKGFGMLRDRFGMPWMVNVEDPAA